jgi:hypothetical protein
MLVPCSILKTLNAGLFRQGVLAEAGRFVQLHTGGES